MRVRSLLPLLLVAACSRDRVEVAPTPASAIPTPTATPTPTPIPTATPTATPTPIRLPIASARAALRSPSAPTRVVGGVYLLVSPRAEPALDSAATLLSASLDAFVPARFGRLPAEPVTVFVFSTVTEYERFCHDHYSAVHPTPREPSEADTCLDSLGVYFHPRRELVIDAVRGRATLVHELAHSLFEFQAPVWFDECVSSQYEWPDFPADQPGEVHGKSNFRHQRLLDALVSPAEQGSVRVDALFGMRDETFLGRPATGETRRRLASLHYGLARETCRWLDARGLLWPMYREWRDRAGVDPTGEAAFAHVVGQTPKQANAEWLAWVKDPKNDDRTPGRVP